MYNLSDDSEIDLQVDEDVTSTMAQLSMWHIICWYTTTGVEYFRFAVLIWGMMHEQITVH